MRSLIDDITGYTYLIVNQNESTSLEVFKHDEKSAWISQIEVVSVIRERYPEIDNFLIYN